MMWRSTRMRYVCHSWKAHHQGRKKGHVAEGKEGRGREARQWIPLLTVIKNAFVALKRKFITSFSGIRWGSSLKTERKGRRKPQVPNLNPWSKQTKNNSTEPSSTRSGKTKWIEPYISHTKLVHISIYVICLKGNDDEDSTTSMKIIDWLCCLGHWT